jgi:hypothetical protein
MPMPKQKQQNLFHPETERMRFNSGTKYLALAAVLILTPLVYWPGPQAGHFAYPRQHSHVSNETATRPCKISTLRWISTCA